MLSPVILKNVGLKLKWLMCTNYTDFGIGLHDVYLFSSPAGKRSAASRAARGLEPNVFIAVKVMLYIMIGLYLSIIRPYINFGLAWFIN